MTTAVRRAGDVPQGQWVEVCYEIRSEGVRPSGQVIRHLVGPELEVRSEPVTSLPERGVGVEGWQPPSWLAAAVAASRRRFEADYEAARAENEASKAEAVARAKRSFAYRRLRLMVLIQEQEAWIKEKELAGSDRGRRVLPARGGQLAKNRERLAGLELAHKAELDEIRTHQPGASATVLAAGVVLGG